MHLREFFWPDGARPGYALRWDVDDGEAHVDICSATTASYVDGRRDEDWVMSDGNAGNDMPLDGPWVAEFTMAVRFDGFARMWCEDLQLGQSGDVDALALLFQYVYARAEELIAALPR